MLTVQPCSASFLANHLLRFMSTSALHTLIAVLQDASADVSAADKLGGIPDDASHVLVR